MLWSLSVDFGRPTFAIMSGHLQPSFWPDYLFIASHGSYHASYISSYSQRMISLTAVWICAIRQFPLFTGFDSYGMHWISLGCHAYGFCRLSVSLSRSEGFTKLNSNQKCFNSCLCLESTPRPVGPKDCGHNLRLSVYLSLSSLLTRPI